MKTIYLDIIFYFTNSLSALLFAACLAWLLGVGSLGWLVSFIADEWSFFLVVLIFCYTAYFFLKSHHVKKKSKQPDKEWWKKGVIYQLYPRSFKDTNGDGIGDLKGITEKIDYFKQIGVDIIYLNPICPSGGKDNGYDIVSYTDIDKVYGTMNDFDNLVKKLHENDMHIIMDFIPNHTSDKHEWFIKSSESDSPNNPYRDYYIWYPSNDKINPPNNWVPVIGKSAWTYNEKRKAWYYHSFLPEQPDLNMRCPKVQEEMKKVLKFWLHTKNIDGIRIDAIKHLFEDALLKDEPESDFGECSDQMRKFETLNHIYTIEQPENYAILAEWKAYIEKISSEKKREKIIYTESHSSPSQVSKYFHHNDKPAANFPLNFQLLGLRENESESLTRKAFDKFNPSKLKSLISEWNSCSNTKYFWSNWQLGNHDVSRIGSRIGQKNVKLANALCLLIGGTPLTYYGEEIGMEDLNYDLISFEDCQDDFAKMFGPERYKNYNRDNNRSPMQWDNTINSGFTKPNTKPWLPINSNYTIMNVKQQLENPKSTLRVYSDLTRIRKNPSFIYGDFRFAIVDEHIFSFIRHAHDNPLFLVALNLSDEDITTNFYSSGLLPSEIKSVYYFDNDGKQVYPKNKKIFTKSVFLPARSCVIGSWSTE